jgi:APA family basic amino acid/polyamine antiporter
MTERYDELSRRVTTSGAVILGLGAMLGAGVFSAIGPAADVAGSWLLAGLVIAGAVAFANATSSAQLAARHPESGGTYVYARERLGDGWGFLAGWAFVIGKAASLSAIALTLGAYVYPSSPRPVAVGAVAALTFVNYLGVEKTLRLTGVVVAAVLVALVVAVVAMLGGTAGARVISPVPVGALDVLRSAGFLFFAFAGYARIATLGEEVRDPARTIPRAVPIALGITVAVYAVVLTAALVSVGAATLASDPAPIAAAVRAGRWPQLAGVVRAGAAVACTGVLLSLLAGASRTVLAMARRRDLPGPLDAVHPSHRTPYRAEIAVGAVVAGIVLVVDLRGAIGFSSFGVLLYYALANASALRLGPDERTRGPWIAWAGLAGCVLLAFTLPATSIAAGSAVLATGLVLRAVLRR